MIIQTYGEDRRSAAAAEILRKRLSDRSGRLHLFGIPTKVEAEAVEAERGDFAVGYAFPSSLARALAARGVRLADAEKDEDFVKENARMTAAGAIGYLLQTQKQAPTDWKVGIVGYGRIGRELLRLLLFLGAKCKVYTASEEKRLELGEYGIESMLSTEASEPAGRGSRFSELDVLINTAPATLIRRDEAEALREVRVLELASGENLPKEMAYERLAGIPAKNYPLSAAKAYADFVMRAVGEAKDDE